MMPRGAANGAPVMSCDEGRQIHLTEENDEVGRAGYLVYIGVSSDSCRRYALLAAEGERGDQDGSWHGGYNVVRPDRNTELQKYEITDN